MGLSRILQLHAHTHTRPCDAFIFRNHAIRQHASRIQGF